MLNHRRLLMFGVPLLSFTTAAGMGELLVRQWLPAPSGPQFIPDPVVGVRHAPRQRVWVSGGGEYGGWFTTNSHGDPDEERPVRKPPGVYRIAVLGDSMVEAAQVAPAERFTAGLQTLLSDAASLSRAESIEVWNFGNAAFGTAHEWLYYRAHVKAFEPDLVLLVMFPGNDIMNNSYELEVTRAGRPELRPFFTLTAAGELVLRDRRYYDTARARYEESQRRASSRMTVTALADRLRTVQLARDAYATARRAIAATSDGDPDARQRAVYLELFDVAVQQSSPLWQRAWRTTGALVRAFADDVRNDGTAFHVAMLPGRWEAEAPPDVPRDRAYQWDLSIRRLEALLADTSVSYTNLLPGITDAAASRNDPLYFPSDSHLTATGHAVVAHALRDALLPVLRRDLTAGLAARHD
jgi:lysophospholipase L1-like esterase